MHCSMICIVDWFTSNPYPVVRSASHDITSLRFHAYYIRENAQKKVLENTVSQRTADLKESNQTLEEQKKEIQLQAFELEKMKLKSTTQHNVLPSFG